MSTRKTSATTSKPGSFAALAAYEPRGSSSAGRDAQADLFGQLPRERLGGRLAGLGLPPGCMNAVVPALRTSSRRPSASVMTAAETWIRRGGVASGITSAR